MFIVHSDLVVPVDPSEVPDYDQANPTTKLATLLEQNELAVEREHYLNDAIQVLIPYDQLTLYGPAGQSSSVLDPVLQDNKTDFQKQNLKDFSCTDTIITRGIVSAGDWSGPFLRLSYRGGPDSLLSQRANHQLGSSIKVFLSISGRSRLIDCPYNERIDRYAVEIWGYPSTDLMSQLDARGRDALGRGELVVDPDLVRGNLSDFQRNKLNGLKIQEYIVEHTMHPVLPLHLEIAWTDATQTFWDSKEGANYQYEFNMILRGWENFLGTGISSNPHGGVGFLEYRNLMSNYGDYASSNELGRQLNSWNFNAFGTKNPVPDTEPFFAVDYMDLHLLKPRCAIGLHRHRDNQEMFLMMEGEGLMVIGDWLQMPERERCFEVRRLRSGHFAMLKGGNLHALVNTTDQDISLFMCGGYD